MCDPASLMIAGGVLGGVGSVYSGFTQGQAYQQEAAFSDRQAVMERQAGSYEAGRIRSGNDRVIASTKNSFLSNGIALDGSAAEVVADMARESALDENAALYGAQVRGDNLRFRAKLARANATSAVVGGLLSGVSSTLNGFTGAQQYTSLYTPNRTQIGISPYATYQGGYGIGEGIY